MREIKFRAWDGYKMFNVDVLAISECTWGCPDNGTRGVSLAYQPSIKVMQYTGLTDKNGTEIYDGDLLTDMVGDVFEVFYNTAHCAYMAEYVRTKHAEKKRGYFKLGDQCSLTIEVIGNIWENPELLK